MYVPATPALTAPPLTPAGIVTGVDEAPAPAPPATTNHRPRYRTRHLADERRWASLAGAIGLRVAHRPVGRPKAHRPHHPVRRPRVYRLVEVSWYGGGGTLACGGSLTSSHAGCREQDPALRHARELALPRAHRAGAGDRPRPLRGRPRIRPHRSDGARARFRRRGGDVGVRVSVASAYDSGGAGGRRPPPTIATQRSWNGLRTFLTIPEAPRLSLSGRCCPSPNPFLCRPVCSLLWRSW